MGFVGTKPTISSNVVIANAGTIGSASDEDAIAIAADGSVTFTQDIELGHASDTTIARASSGQITVEGTAVLLAGAQTGITTILNASTKIGRSAANLIDFATTDNKLIFRVEGVDEVELVQNALSPVTSDGVSLGTGSLMWSDIFLASASVINFNNGDVSITHTANLLTITGGGLVVGVNDTGHDVKFFGASAGAYMEWDESADQLRIMGASADATTSTGKLLLATSLTDINANDVIGKVEFQAPHEADGTDAITVAAAIEAVAQGTFSASVNATDILFKTGHSEAATEKFRFTSQGEIGIGGANYGTDGQLLTSGGAGAATAWEDAPAGGSSFTATADGAISAGDLVSLKGDGEIEKCDSIQGGLAFGDSYSPSGTEIENAQTYYCAVGFDPDNNKLAVGYRDSGNSNYPTIAMGKVASATTVAFGTPTVCESAAASAQTGMELPYDTNVDRFCYVYTTAAGGRALVFTINNTTTHTITQGSAVLINDSVLSYTATFDSTTNRVLALFRDDDDSNKLKAVAFTVQGASDNDITAIGSLLEVYGADTGASNGDGLGFDSNDNKVVAVYRATSNSNRPEAVSLLIDASDNSITKGTAVQLSTTVLTTYEPVTVVHDPVLNINVAIAFIASATGFQVIPFTCASGAITAGTATTHNDKDTDTIEELGRYCPAQYDPDANKIVIFNGANGAQVYVGGISGTGASATFVQDAFALLKPKAGVTVGTEVGGRWSYPVCAYDTNDNKHFLAFTNGTGDTGLYGILPPVPKNASNFIGFANSSISDDAAGTVTTSGGVATGQSSLTIGSHYYVNSSGALTTTSGTVHAGKALTATTLLVNAPHV